MIIARFDVLFWTDVERFSIKDVFKCVNDSAFLCDWLFCVACADIVLMVAPWPSFLNLGWAENSEKNKIDDGIVLFDRD